MSLLYLAVDVLLIAGVWLGILYCASYLAEPLLMHYKKQKGIAHHLIGLCLVFLYLTTAYLCYLVTQAAM